MTPRLAGAMHRRRLPRRQLVEAALAGVRPRRRVLQVAGVLRRLAEQRLAPRTTTRAGGDDFFDRNTPTDGGELTALSYAARSNDLESVKILLAAGADVNEVTGYGWSPLLIATQNRNYKLGAFLLEHGANPNLANKGGWKPLYLATDNRNIENGDYPVRKGDMDHLDFIKLLLDKGAERERPDEGQHGNADGVHQPVARRERRDARSCGRRSPAMSS